MFVRNSRHKQACHQLSNLLNISLRRGNIDDEFGAVRIVALDKERPPCRPTIFLDDRETESADPFFGAVRTILTSARNVVLQLGGIRDLSPQSRAGSHRRKLARQTYRFRPTSVAERVADQFRNVTQESFTGRRLTGTELD